MSGSIFSNLAHAQDATDAAFGFPSGTMSALAQSETSGGTNLGSIGNIYQITPSTAQYPGYGVTGKGSGPNGTLDGNNPYDAGLYLNGIMQSNGGNLTAALAQYQGYGSNPKNYQPNTAMQEFLSGLGLFTGGAAAATGGQGAAPAQLTPGEAARSPVTAVGGASSWLDSKLGISSALLRIFVAILALVLVVIGLASLALKSSPAAVVKGVVK